VKKKVFAKHVNQNPELKKWLIENQEWVMANPQTMRQLINRWSYVQSLQPSSQGFNQVRPKNGGFPLNKKLKLPKMNLDTVSQATQQLTRTMGMLENMKNIAGIFGFK